MTPSFVVTGGARGVGRAIAERLSDDGRVVVVDLHGAADVVAHLLATGFVDGAVIPVDGGRAALGSDPEAQTVT